MIETVEIWRDIPGYEGKYKINEEGKVLSLGRLTPNKQGMCNRKDKILKQHLTPIGYYRVKLYKDKNTKHTCFVHKLVAETFLENPDNYIEVNHIDGNKLNNHYINIEWCSRSHNVRETYRLGLKPESTYKGSGNATSKLTEDQVLSIRDEYSIGGISQKSLAVKYNVSLSLIHMLVHRQIWKHI